MKTKGLIPEYVSMSKKVNPQGEMQAIWLNVLKDQIERDEARMYASEEYKTLPIVEEKKRLSFKKWFAPYNPLHI